jgi:hypothetical protein
VVAASEFVKQLSAGMARPEQLTDEFLRFIGRPWELPSDKQAGYSLLAAESWLKRVGTGRTYSPPTGRANAQVALLSGTAQGPHGPVRYYLRLLATDTPGWKIDGLVLSTAEIQAELPPTGEPWAAGMALHSWLAALADRRTLAPDDRALLIAAGLAPELRQQWAAPFDSDRAMGYDFNRGQLLLKADALIQSPPVQLRPLDPPRHWQVECGPSINIKQNKRWVLMLEAGNKAGRWHITRLQETP